MSHNLSVVLVHRNEFERAQLRSSFETMKGVTVSGERPDLRSGLALAAQIRPHILVLELSPVEEALNAASQFRMEHPETAIFFSTEQFDPDLLLRAMRAGAVEVLRRPLDRPALTQAVERVGQITARKGGGGGGAVRTVITVFSNKGGSGVSTIATNLAVSLRRFTNREVALADFDYQSGDVAFLLGVSPKRSISNVLAAPRIDGATVQDALLRHSSGVHVLPQPEQLEQVEAVQSGQFGQVLQIMSDTFDIVVVDAPHVVNDLTLEIFDRSNTILLVGEPSVPSVRAARRSLEIFSKLNYLVVPDRIRLIVNRRSDQSAITLEQMEETLGLPVFGSIANDYAAVSGAINMGKPLCGDGSEGRAARDISAIARQLIPGEAPKLPSVEDVQEKPRMFGGLFGRR